MVKRIHIAYPLKRVPNGGLYRYNGRFYRKVFSIPSRNYCWSVLEDDHSHGCASILNMFVDYYAEQVRPSL